MSYLIPKYQISFQLFQTYIQIFKQHVLMLQKLFDKRVIFCELTMNKIFRLNKFFELKIFALSTEQLDISSQKPITWNFHYIFWKETMNYYYYYNYYLYFILNGISWAIFTKITYLHLNWFKNLHLKPITRHSFPTVWKHQRTFKFSNVFREERKSALWTKWVRNVKFYSSKSNFRFTFLF